MTHFPVFRRREANAGNMGRVSGKAKTRLDEISVIFRQDLRKAAA